MTLEELKKALDAVPPNPRFSGGDLTWMNLGRYEQRRADAWKAAFEWRDGIEVRRENLRLQGVIHSGELYAEAQEGMRLIREKLA